MKATTMSKMAAPLALLLLALATRQEMQIDAFLVPHQLQGRSSLSVAPKTGRHLTSSEAPQGLWSAAAAAAGPLRMAASKNGKKENNVDIDDVMAETEAALQAAEEALTEEEKEARRTLSLRSKTLPVEEKEKEDIAKPSAKFSLPTPPWSNGSSTTPEVSKEPQQPPEPTVDEIDRQMAQQQLAEAKQKAKQQLQVLSDRDKPTKLQRTPEEDQLVAASAIGGIVVGAVLGVAAVSNIPEVAESMEPVVASFLFGVLFGAAGFVTAASDGPVAPVSRTILGVPIKAIGSSIAGAITSVFTGIATSAQAQAKRTTEEIKAIPGRLADRAAKKVEATAKEISAVPGKVKAAAQAKATEVAEEIKATPGRVAKSTRRAVEDAVDDTIDAVEKVVEEVTAIPQRTIESIESKVSSITKKIPDPPKLPQAPTLPALPTSSDTEGSSAPVMKKSEPETKAESILPKIEVPKLEIDVPKLEIPKIEGLSLPTGPAKQQSSAADEAKKKRLAAQAAKEKQAETLRKAEEALQKSRQAAEARKAVAMRKKAEAVEAARRQSEREEAEAERKQQAEEAAEERKRQIEAAAAERKRQAEEAEKRRQAEASAKKAEADKKKRQAEAKKQLAQAKPRATMSLGNLFNFGASNDEEDQTSKPTTTISASSKPLLNTAPRGVPTISQWRQNRDGSITGKISGSPNFTDGEPITTSPVPKDASTGAVVQTSSGSRYFLGNQRGFSLGISLENLVGGLESTATSTPSPSPAEKAANAAQQKMEERKAAMAAAAEQKRKEAEEKRAAAAAAAEQRRIDMENKKKAAADAAAKRKQEMAEKAAAIQAKKQASDQAAEKRRQEAEAKKKATAEAAAKRQQEVEAKKQAAAEAAEKRKQEVDAKKQAAAEAAEKRRQEAEAKRQEAAAKRQQEQEAKKAAVEERRRQAEEKKAAAVEARRKQEEEKREVIRKRSREAERQRKATPASVPKMVEPPRGVPVIKSWKERRDGGISGRIYGSSNFEEGDFIETSPISKGTKSDGSVVQTSSGSRYFLSPEPAVKQANILAAIKDMTIAKPGSTITLTKERKEREAKAAMDAVKQAKPRATFSLFGLGAGAAEKGLPKESSSKSSTSTRPVATSKQAPPGVPTFSRWRQNRDGSITGIIKGSKSFNDGDRVTTSPIAKGTIGKQEVVTTGSGSRYFLS